MKPTSMFVVIIVIILASFSCEKSNPAGPGENSSVRKLPMVLDTALIPLHTGYAWLYVDSVFYSPDSVMVYHYNWSVGGNRYIYSKGDSVEVYVFRISRDGGSQNEYYYRVNPEGLVRYSSLETDTLGHYSLQSLMLKYPVQRGETWQENHGDYSDQKTCLSEDTVIATAGGNLHCFIIRTGPGNPWYEDEYYCLNFGKVGGYAELKSGGSTIITKTTFLALATPKSIPGM